jgi:replication-associated recombination protein RarA
MRDYGVYIRTRLTFCSYYIVCSVNATEGGKNAILALAGGDLRRVLNLLQSTAMAYPQVL